MIFFIEVVQIGLMSRNRQHESVSIIMQSR